MGHNENLEVYLKKSTLLLVLIYLKGFVVFRSVLLWFHSLWEIVIVLASDTGLVYHWAFFFLYWEKLLRYRYSKDKEVVSDSCCDARIFPGLWRCRKTITQRISRMRRDGLCYFSSSVSCDAVPKSRLPCSLRLYRHTNRLYCTVTFILCYIPSHLLSSVTLYRHAFHHLWRCTVTLTVLLDVVPSHNSFKFQVYPHPRVTKLLTAVQFHCILTIL